MGFNAVLGVLNSFPREKVIVNRERAANAYDVFSYFVAKFLTELPLNVLPAFVFGCVVYWIVGLNSDRFGEFLGICMLEALTGVSLGLAISAFAPNFEAANALGPPLVVIALVFGGFYINLDTLPIVANGLPYLSMIRWAFEVGDMCSVIVSCLTSCNSTGLLHQRIRWRDLFVRWGAAGSLHPDRGAGPGEPVVWRAHH
jgi:ABC-type multidrug transport system permease subunit